MYGDGIAESTHFDRLTNLVHYRREPETFVRSGNTVVPTVVHVYIVGMGTGGYWREPG